MQLYNSQSRQETVEKLLEALEADRRISGALLVGSGAYGFKDAFSDIDLAVVTSEEQDALTVFRDWESVIRELLPVLWGFTDIRGPETGLYAVILEDFLEIDISFQSLAALSARTPNWKVIFDRAGKIQDVLRESWAEKTEADIEATYTRRLDSIWHYVTHVAVSLKRGQLWRATHYLEEIRNRTIELEGLICHCQTRHFREVDQLPEERLSALERTFPAQLTRDELWRALYAATDCFFETAARVDGILGNRRSDTLREAMEQFLLYTKN
ncbi:MAG TPA: hypothetical protein ENJ93_05830 [Chloroflexi bacterium]|nr:hypothetical protein [Chloroflexota bacterium]